MPVPLRGAAGNNVNLEDVTIQVPVLVAANICGVSVGVLSQAETLADVVCTNDGTIALAENI